MCGRGEAGEQPQNNKEVNINGIFFIMKCLHNGDLTKKEEHFCESRKALKNCNIHVRLVTI